MHVLNPGARHADMPDVTANQHHAQAHTAAHDPAGADPLGLTYRHLRGKIAAAQTVNNSTTLVNATNLAFAIAANEEWVAEFFLDLTSPTAADLKLEVTIPAGASGIFHAVGIPSIVPSGFMLLANSLGVGGVDFGSANLDFISFGQVRIVVYVTNGANAGTVQLQFAQSAAVVGDTTLKAPSYYLAHRLA